MNYDTSHLKVDQFIAYVNEGKINLIPSFQRGHVWTPIMRKRLIANMVKSKPIPAVFLYREASGATYAYNILDGKQRLESVILFVGNKRGDLSVAGVGRYFYSQKDKGQLNFAIKHGGSEVTFRELDDEAVRDFRDYKIPTIEITLDDDATLKDLIDLFVDINSSGAKVKRFDIVKAMSSNDKLLKGVLDLVASRRKRRKDIFYLLKRNPFTWVLERLSTVSTIYDHNARVDRMWELLVELFLFARHRQHRPPVDILKGFITPRSQKEPDVTDNEAKLMAAVFRFLRNAYGNANLMNSRLAANQIHFYTMVTSLIDSDLRKRFDDKALIKKLASFGMMLDGKKAVPRNLQRAFRQYAEVAGRHTTHPGRRKERQDLFLRLIAML